MGFKRLAWVFIFILAFYLPIQAALAGSDQVKGQMKAYRVVKNQNGGEKFIPADKAHPKDTIEYQLTYKNTGSSPVRNLSIVDPVPYGMCYVPASIKKPPEAKVTFSIDMGKSYSTWPVMIREKTPGGKEKTVPAKPEMITHIRWIMDGSLAPESEFTVSYRAYVK